MPTKRITYNNEYVADVCVRRTSSEVHPFAVVVHAFKTHGPSTAAYACKTGLEALRMYHNICRLMMGGVYIGGVRI